MYAETIISLNTTAYVLKSCPVVILNNFASARFLEKYFVCRIAYGPIDNSLILALYLKAHLSKFYQHTYFSILNIFVEAIFCQKRFLREMAYGPIDNQPNFSLSIEAHMSKFCPYPYFSILYNFVEASFS